MEPIGSDVLIPESDYEEVSEANQEEANSGTDGSSSSAPLDCRRWEPALRLGEPRLGTADGKDERKKQPNKYRFQKPYKVPRSRLPEEHEKRKSKKKPVQSDFKVPLRQILNVPFLRKNPYIYRIMSFDGASSVKEAAAITTWSTIETALLILNYLEGKKQELAALRAYACKAIYTCHSSKNSPDDEKICSPDMCTIPKMFVPMEYSMFYNYQYSNPLFIWPCERDFNLFVGLRAIDEYIQLRLNWMKGINFGINYNHFEKDKSSINHIYSVVGCNMRSGYPIGQTTINIIFVIVSKHTAADPSQRVSARFFIEGCPTEFVPMYNDHLFCERLVRIITNRKIRYYSKFHLTESSLRQERTTEEQMQFRKRLMKGYRKAMDTNIALSSKNTVSIPVYSTLCGFCISFNDQCALHGNKCHWDELFSVEVAAKASHPPNIELDKTIIRDSREVFWPDVKKPIKNLFERQILLW